MVGISNDVRYGDRTWLGLYHGDDIDVVEDNQSTTPVPVSLNLGIVCDGSGKAGDDKGREGYLGIVSRR